MNSLTVLTAYSNPKNRHKSNTVLAKAWGEQGTVEYLTKEPSKSYQRRVNRSAVAMGYPHYFTMQAIATPDLDALHALLVEMQYNSDACVVFTQPLANIDLSYPVKRAGTFDGESYSNLLVIDIDGGLGEDAWEYPDGSHPRDDVDAAQEAITELLDEHVPLLADVDYVIRFSGSAHIDNSVRCHLYAVLTEYVPVKLLRRFIQTIGGDASIYDTGHTLFTCNPVFTDGHPDPISQRMLLVRNGCAVALDATLIQAATAAEVVERRVTTYEKREANKSVNKTLQALVTQDGGTHETFSFLGFAVAAGIASIDECKAAITERCQTIDRYAGHDERQMRELMDFVKWYEQKRATDPDGFERRKQSMRKKHANSLKLVKNTAILDRNKDALPVADARERLATVIKDAIPVIKGSINDGGLRLVGHTAIKASPGLGKTTQVIEFAHKNKLSIDIAVPTEAQARELEARYPFVTRLKPYSEACPLYAEHNAGINTIAESDPDAAGYIRRNYCGVFCGVQVKTVNDAGEVVGIERQCEQDRGEMCPYHAQFIPTKSPRGKIWSKQFYAEQARRSDKPRIQVITHARLTIPLRGKTTGRVSRLVIDENPYNTVARRVSYACDELEMAGGAVTEAYRLIQDGQLFGLPDDDRARLVDELLETKKGLNQSNDSGTPPRYKMPLSEIQAPTQTHRTLTGFIDKVIICLGGIRDDDYDAAGECDEPKVEYHPNQVAVEWDRRGRDRRLVVSFYGIKPLSNIYYGAPVTLLDGTLDTDVFQGLLNVTAQKYNSAKLDREETTQQYSTDFDKFEVKAFSNETIYQVGNYRMNLEQQLYPDNLAAVAFLRERLNCPAVLNKKPLADSGMDENVAFHYYVGMGINRFENANTIILYGAPLLNYSVAETYVRQLHPDRLQHGCGTTVIHSQLEGRTHSITTRAQVHTDPAIEQAYSKIRRNLARQSIARIRGVNKEQPVTVIVVTSVELGLLPDAIVRLGDVLPDVRLIKTYQHTGNTDVNPQALIDAGVYTPEQRHVASQFVSVNSEKINTLHTLITRNTLPCLNRGVDTDDADDYTSEVNIDIKTEDNMELEKTDGVFDFDVGAGSPEALESERADTEKQVWGYSYPDADIQLYLKGSQYTADWLFEQRAYRRYESVVIDCELRGDYYLLNATEQIPSNDALDIVRYFARGQGFTPIKKTEGGW